MRYPDTRRDDVVETLHGHEVADPYRWLEDPDAEDTAAWVREQNTLTRSHLDGLASLPWFRDTVRAIVTRPRAGTPDKIGSRYVVSRNDGSQQQDVWFVGDTFEELSERSRLLLDPNTFSADGTSSLAAYSHSRDGRWLAYHVSDGGSDWTTIRMLDLVAGHEVDDVVGKVKFSEATWLPDHSSYLYLHYPVDGAGIGTEAGALPPGRLTRHRVGESQDGDELVLEFPENPRLGITPEVSHDGRWLVLNIHEGTSEKNRLWVCPLTTADGACQIGEPLKLADEAFAGWHFVRTDGSWLHLLTDHEAPLRRVVKVDLEAFARTGQAEYVDVVAESEHLLEQVLSAGDELVTVHLADAAPLLTRHVLDGASRGTVDLPGGAVVALHGEVGDPEVFVGMSTLTTPESSFRLDLDSGEVTPVDLAPAGETTWSPPDLITERRRATSADGTPVPYFLVRRSDAPAEPAPTLLWGYGGFGISLGTAYRTSFAGWLAAGGTLAIANLRGGGEYGTAWHDGGRLRDKPHVFDDFVAVAEHLVGEGVTTHAQLALHGASNGGLLVGATMTRRPDLAAVAIPAVGVMDMLRFHLFTIGGAWVPDYGSPDDPEMFEVLLGYSPLHRLSEGTAYPATLVMTGDHDDRVVPAHSFKFTAQLQRCQGGEAPVLARIETATGHGLGKPVSVVVAETADLLAFAAEHTGLVPPA